MTTIDELPDPSDDLAGLLRGLAAIQGDAWVFHLIGRIRDTGGPAGAIRSELARRMVEKEMDRTGVGEKAAIRAVGIGLGYTPQVRGPGRDRAKSTGGTLANFALLVRGLTRTTRRPLRTED